jgi:osmoprotectant transport system ATP-binding protein
MIRFDNVSKRYPDGTVAVDALSLEAPTGKITVFVGPSGCGKTTSLRMINRMIDPTSGSIWIDDTNAADLPAHELRRKIGYVIQHAGLFPHRTIIDNIATVPYLLGQDKKEARAGAAELLERVGLPAHFAKRYPAQLSGGQQQRVGVARALAADPPVMLMDEPFSAVDPVVREQLQEQFLQLQGDLGKTIAFVTHDIDEAIKLGDQIAVMQVGGKLSQLATPVELLSRPANAFVAGFVGRDRGYRALGFAEGSDLPSHDEPTVRLGADLPIGADHSDGQGSWVLVVDDEGIPHGWLDLDEQPLGTLHVEEANLYRGGTLAVQGGSLRAALDACLSSPSGRGVVVDRDGKFTGTMLLQEIVGLIERRAAEQTAQSAVRREPAS